MFQGYAFVDWDDTIAENIAHFVRVETEMSRLIGAALNMPPPEVYAAGRRWDLAIAREMGLVRQSFPTGWTRCYEELCQQAGRQPDAALRQEIWQMADAVYDQKQAVVPGARDTLRWLRRSGFELTLWTAGEPATQRRKVQRAGLAGLFHRSVVVPHKDAALLGAALGPRDRSRTAVIGNSARSDVAPALELGVLAVHIPVETWAYDEHPLDTSHPCYVLVESIALVPGALAERLGVPSREAVE